MRENTNSSEKNNYKNPTPTSLLYIQQHLNWACFHQQWRCFYIPYGGKKIPSQLHSFDRFFFFCAKSNTENQSSSFMRLRGKILNIVVSFGWGQGGSLGYTAVGSPHLWCECIYFMRRSYGINTHTRPTSFYMARGYMTFSILKKLWKLLWKIASCLKKNRSVTRKKSWTRGIAFFMQWSLGKLEIFTDLYLSSYAFLGKVQKWNRNTWTMPIPVNDTRGCSQAL